MNRLSIFIFLFLTLAKLSVAQSDDTDSLINELSITKNDTAKIIILNRIALNLHSSKPEKSLEYAQKALQISEDNDYFEHLSGTYSALAAASWVLSDYVLGLDYLFKKLKIHEDKKEYRKVAKTYNHIAIIFNASDKDSLALVYVNMSLNICKKNNYKLELADAYNVAANIYYKNFDSSKVEEYWQEALRIFKEENKELKASSIEHNLGMLFYDNKEYDKALELFNATLKTCVKYSDILCIATTLENIGSVYAETKKYDLAEKYFFQLRDTARRYGMSKVEMRSYILLSELDTVLENYEQAYRNYTEYTKLKDSIFSQNNEKEISELQIQYETEKTAKENISLRKEQKINKLIVSMLGISLFSVMLVLFFMWRMIKTKQANNSILLKKNKEIQLQQRQILEQNEELRIQSDELVLHEEHLKELVEERTKELIMANEKAKESDQLKSAFLTNVSHEIRTPMNAIIGFTDLLAIPNLSDTERDEYLGVIQGSSNRLLNLINDIIDLSKIEVGRVQINKVDFSLNEVMLELLSKFSNKKTDLIELIYDNKADSNKVNIYTDKIRLSQIISNLLDNALKFTDSGFVNFGYNIKDNQAIEFYVKDTGIGISKDKQKIIFERFRKIEDDNAKLYQGTGLGLTISKSLTEMLGGEMWLASDPQKGSEFKFSLIYKKTPNE